MEEAGEGRGHFALGAIDDAANGGESVEAMGLDRGDDGARLAGGGNEDEPAARGDAVFGNAEDAVGEGIAQAKVIEEPAVEGGVGEGGGDFGEA